MQLCALAPVVLDHVVAVAVAGEAQLIGHRGLDGDRGIGRGDEVGSADAGHGCAVLDISAGGVGVAAVVVAVGGGGVCVPDVADDGADVVFTVGGRAADGGVDHVAVLDEVAAARGAPADEGAKVHAKVNGRRGFGGGAEEDDVPDGGAFDLAEEADAAVVYADGEAADGVAAAVVGAGEAIAAGQFAYGREVAAAGEVDVGGLAEGLAGGGVIAGGRRRCLLRWSRRSAGCRTWREASW